MTLASLVLDVLIGAGAGVAAEGPTLTLESKISDGLSAVISRQ